MGAGEKTRNAQGEAHHGQQGQDKLQDGEVEEGGEQDAGGAELQGCGL